MATKAKNNKSTSVATVNTNVIIPRTSADVPQAIEALKQQLAGLKSNVEEKVSTDISYNGTSIKNIKSVKELLEISASIEARSEAYAKQMSRYQLDEKLIQPWSQSDKTAAQWFVIIKKAIFELTNAKQIETLENAIAKLSKHLDAETRLQNDLAEIMNAATAPLV